jgi:hypothetical protein
LEENDEYDDDEQKFEPKNEDDDYNMEELSNNDDNNIDEELESESFPKATVFKNQSHPKKKKPSALSYGSKRSRNKCPLCSKIFPRPKNLAAHLLEKKSLSKRSNFKFNPHKLPNLSRIIPIEILFCHPFPISTH